MLKGIYSAAAGMTSHLIQNDIIADNLANASTPGFKPSMAQFKSFKDKLVEKMSSDDSKTRLGSYGAGSEIRGTVINFAQGDLVQTGNPLDLALKGDGFFTMKSKGSETLLYTRTGSFTVDSEGFLSTDSGNRLQGVEGEIQIPQNTKDIKVANDGSVSADGKRLGKIKLAQFADNQQLEKVGSNAFTSTVAPKAGTQNVAIEQGCVENSGSNVITEMVNSMTGLRTYELLQRSIQMQNETLGQSIKEVGRPS